MMFELIAPLSAALRVALGLLFLRAAGGKLRDLPGFATIVLEYDLLPVSLAPTVAALLVVSEGLAAALLLSGVWPWLAGALATALLSLFAMAMAVSLSRGRAGIACGCAGQGGATLSRQGVLGTAALIPAALGATLPWRGDTLTLVQATLAGLLLFTLHAAALRLAELPKLRTTRR